MYGKLFARMYDGTLHGHWEAIVTLQQLVILCGPDGMVEKTMSAISAITSIPVEIIEKGISKLEEPDPESRTEGEDGRRIVRIDPSRPWGWQIVNYDRYRKLKDPKEAREEAAARMRRLREERRTADHAGGAVRDVRDVRSCSGCSGEVEVKGEGEAEKTGVVSGAEAPSAGFIADETVGDPEAEQVAESLASVILIPLKSGRPYPVSAEQVAAWTRDFPALDVRSQILSLRDWSLQNPSKRKTLRGVRLFLVAALKREAKKITEGTSPEAAERRAADEEYSKQLSRKGAE